MLNITGLPIYEEQQVEKKVQEVTVERLKACYARADNTKTYLRKKHYNNDKYLEIIDDLLNSTVKFETNDFEEEVLNREWMNYYDI